MMKFTSILTLIVSAALAQNDCQTSRLNAVKSGNAPARGTNLGNWFVLESWMNEALWINNNCNKTTQDGCYLFEKCLGDRASTVMQQHWSSWINESTFQEMSSRGVNLVRLPVGWWHIYDTQQGGAAAANLAVTPTDYATGALAYIDKAFTWAEQYGIAILLCMHAAPGSQNGQPHSSPAEYPGQINWDKFESNVAQTVESIGLYAEHYANSPALYGFSLLNEPAHVNISVLQDYYLRAYERIRQYSTDSYIIINPLIAPFEYGTEDYWVSFMNPGQGYNKVGMDLHYYSCFGGPSSSSNSDDAINYITTTRQSDINDYQSKTQKGMLIGEWSACNKFNNDSKIPDFVQAQVKVYGNTTYGWTFWSWTDGSYNNIWSLKTAFDQGWLSNQYSC